MVDCQNSVSGSSGELVNWTVWFIGPNGNADLKDRRRLATTLNNSRKKRDERTIARTERDDGTLISSITRLVIPRAPPPAGARNCFN